MWFTVRVWDETARTRLAFCFYWILTSKAIFLDKRGEYVENFSVRTWNLLVVYCGPSPSQRNQLQWKATRYRDKGLDCTNTRAASFLSFFLSFLLFWKSKGLEELVSKSTLFPKKLYITVKVVQLFSFGWRCSEEAILLTFTHLTVHFLILFLESEVWKSYQKHL